MSFSKEDRIRATEAKIAEQREQIARRDAVLRLTDNPDFKKIVVDGFLLHDAATYVQVAGDPSVPKDSREDALNIAMASGHFKRFLSITIQMGNVAENSLPAYAQEVEDLRATPAEEFEQPVYDEGDE